MTEPVRDNPSRNRFELQTAAGLAIANYRRDDLTITITHTEVPRAVEGRGIGSALVKGMLDEIRREGRKVVPLCSFVRAYINRHPEYRDLT
ncbi:GNAT family N-acetyltransferase [Undibacter mobilis]|uniref:N-acetyltransferase n=1 Tax=Undibacter mobilis TaxID=2292256 RepID=A0A371B1B4_9BRAD|nr:GNAT family N-acetyltransferase [Undibacter mobilis]RDV01322.1 N-acetyltransferase [Undibacter mobilis]